MPDRTHLRATWDGLFISEEPPHGATVMVFRRGATTSEYLVLRRAQADADDADWAWGPPAGARLPGEEVDACAQRELEEETGLCLDLHRVARDPAWATYWAEADAGSDIRLSPEHDRYEWVSLDEAIARCRPARVADSFVALAEAAAAA